MTSFEEKTFKLSGGREMVDEGRAQELLTAATTGETGPYIGINLSNKSFSHQAAEILANYLQQYKEQIQILDLSDIIAGRHEDEALKVLETLCNMFTPYDNQLIEVNVSDNALGRKGITACQNILQGKNLKKLYFCNNGLSAEASELITDILLQQNGYGQDGSRSCPPLEILHFYNNMSGTVGAQSSSQIILAITNTLRDFRYSATRSGTEGCLPIAQALCQTSNLTHLDVSDNSFGEEVLDALASAISRQTKLISLNLRDAGLGEEGTKEIFKSLQTSQCPLQFLDISGNDLTDEAIPDIINFLQSCPTLQSLSLDDSDFTIEGCRQLGRALKSHAPALQTLSIGTSQLTAGCVLFLARGVSKISSFKTLSVDGNQICSNGIEVIEKVLQDSGKELGRLEDNDEDGEDDLEEVEDEDLETTADSEPTGLENAIENLHVS